MEIAQQQKKATSQKKSPETKGIKVKKQRSLVARFAKGLYNFLEEGYFRTKPSYRDFRKSENQDFSKMTKTELKYKKRELKKKNSDLSIIKEAISDNKKLQSNINTSLETTLLAKVNHGKNELSIGYNTKQKKLLVSNSKMDGVPIWKNSSKENVLAPFRKIPEGDDKTFKVRQELDYINNPPLPKKELKQDINKLVNQIEDNSPAIKQSIQKYDRNALETNKLKENTTIKLDHDHGTGSNLFTVAKKNSSQMFIEPLVKDKNDVPIRLDIAQEKQRLINKDTSQVSSLTKKYKLGFDNHKKDFKIGKNENGKIDWKTTAQFHGSNAKSTIKDKVKSLMKSGDYVLDNTVASFKNGKSKEQSVGITHSGKSMIKEDNGKFMKMTKKQANDIQNGVKNSLISFSGDGTKNSKSSKIDKIINAIKAINGDVQAGLKLAKSLKN